jgi:hypothetical protein
MTFGDTDGLQRAAATLDTLGQRADQERRAVAAVTAALTSRDNWGGAAARAFEASTHNLHGHLRGAAGAAVRTAAVLRQLATDLLAAEDLDQRARQAALAAAAPVTTPRVPTSTPSFGPVDQPDLRARADANALAAREAAEAAWRKAAFALQGIWASELFWAQASDVGNKAGGMAAAWQAAAETRKELADHWRGVEQQRRAGVLASDATGETLGALRDARNAARDNWWKNTKLYGKAEGWAKEGWYARAGHAVNYSVGDLGKAVGVTRAAGEAGGLMRVAGEVPILGIAAGAANTAADIESGVNPTRAVVANTASLLVTTAAVAVLSGPAMPFVATALVIGFVGWGVGNAVHGLLAYGDLTHDFKSDFHAVGNAAGWVGHKAGDAAHAVGRLFKESRLW